MKKEYIQPEMTQVIAIENAMICSSNNISGEVDGPVGAPRRRQLQEDDETDDFVL